MTATKARDALNVEWRDIAGQEGRYQVSIDGQVRGPRGRILKPKITNKGYYAVGIHGPMGSREQRVHRLVAIAFVPNPLGLSDVNHIDADKLNNHASNLEWLSHRANLAHAHALGNFDPAKHPGRLKKLSLDDVRQIRALCDAGQMTHEAIGAQFNISTWQVWRVKSRRCYANVA